MPVVTPNAAVDAPVAAAYGAASGEYAYCLIYTSMNTAAPLEAVCAVFMLERKSAHAHNRTP
jgi:hypothetical protein